MTRRTLIALLGLVALVATSQVHASANNAWNGYHIDDHDGSVEVSVVSHLTEYQEALTQALSDWNASPSPLVMTQGPVESRPDACNNVATDAAGAQIAGTLRVCNAAYGNNGWLGLARIWLTADGHIEASVTLMNDTYLQSSSYNDPVAHRHVMCQEIGHDVGLDHSSRKSRSCMNDRTGLFDPRYVSPSSHDYDQLSAIYSVPTNDPGGGGGPKPCRGKAKKCGAGAHGVTVVPRPNGGTIITYTFPA